MNLLMTGPWPRVRVLISSSNPNIIFLQLNKQLVAMRVVIDGHHLMVICIARQSRVSTALRRAAPGRRRCAS